MNRKIIHIFILVGFVLFTKHISAQNHIVDSLVKVLSNTKTDTARLQVYVALCNVCDVNDNLKYGEPAVDLADEILPQITDRNEKKKIIAEKLLVLGTVIYYYRVKKNNIKALEYMDGEQKKLEEKGDKEGTASMYETIGKFYYDQSIFSKALEYNLKAFSIYQELNDSAEIANCLRGVGAIYNEQGNYPKALEYDMKALETARKSGARYSDISLYDRAVSEQYNNIGDSSESNEYEFKALALVEGHQDKVGIATILLEMGDRSINKHNYSGGLEYVQKSLKLWTEIGNHGGRIAYCLGRIAKIYGALHNYSGAMEYYFKALRLYHVMDYKFEICYSYLRIGEMYTYHLKNYKLARSYLDSAVVGTEATVQLNYIAEAYSTLADMDSLMGNYKAECSDYKMFVLYRDSLKNEKSSEQTLQVEMNYEFNIKADSVRGIEDKKDMQVSADKHKQRIITGSVLGGLLLVLLFAGFVFRSLRITRAQKQLIEIKSKETEAQKMFVEERNKIIEEKNKDILDSINYAKRLQEAILPPLSSIKQSFPESFVLYKPKDIVAGDFYWMEKAGDTIFIAAADCTGHGVPGALVSVVCSNALNRTVKEFRVTEPDKILDKVRELVLETFEKSESNVQDGMDISLCCINAKTNEISWSGAYNSLLYIQNGEMHEILADKQPIGKSDKPHPFTMHKVNLQKGDMFYLLTDGYADQFGGPKGKKFKYKQLQDVLLANASKPMDAQKSTLETILSNWKGNLEQVDDILVIGIRS